MCSLKTAFLARYSVIYDVRLFLNASTSSIFSNFDGKLFQSLMVLEERSCIYKCFCMFVYFWISVGDIAWLSCFVVLYNLRCLSLQVWRWKALWNKHSLLIFRLISKVGNFKSFSMLVMNPALSTVLVFNETALSSLHHFNLFNMIFLVWIPGTTCVFNIRSYYRLIYSFLYFLWEFADISPQEA